MGFKKLGGSAIHDEGFQFFLTLEISNAIENLINDMKTLLECLETHKEWRKNSWYNSKITVSIHRRIDGFEMFHPFTYTLASKVYNERKKLYNILMNFSENALNKAIKSNLKDSQLTVFKPFFEDVERRFIIIDSE